MLTTTVNATKKPKDILPIILHPMQVWRPSTQVNLYQCNCSHRYKTRYKLLRRSSLTSASRVSAPSRSIPSHIDLRQGEMFTRASKSWNLCRAWLVSKTASTLGTIGPSINREGGNTHYYLIVQPRAFISDSVCCSIHSQTRLYHIVLPKHRPNSRSAIDITSLNLDRKVASTSVVTFTITLSANGERTNMSCQMKFLKTLFIAAIFSSSIILKAESKVYTCAESFINMEEYHPPTQITTASQVTNYPSRSRLGLALYHEYVPSHGCVTIKNTGDGRPFSVSTKLKLEFLSFLSSFLNPLSFLHHQYHFISSYTVGYEPVPITKVRVGSVPIELEQVPQRLDLSAWTGQGPWHIPKFHWADQSSWLIGSSVYFIYIKKSLFHISCFFHEEIALFFVACTSNHHMVKTSFEVMVCSLGFDQLKILHDPPQLWHVLNRCWASAKPKHTWPIFGLNWVSAQMHLIQNTASFYSFLKHNLICLYLVSISSIDTSDLTIGSTPSFPTNLNQSSEEIHCPYLIYSPPLMSSRSKNLTINNSPVILIKQSVKPNQIAMRLAEPSSPIRMSQCHIPPCDSLLYSCRYHNNKSIIMPLTLLKIKFSSNFLGIRFIRPISQFPMTKTQPNLQIGSENFKGVCPSPLETLLNSPGTHFFLQNQHFLQPQLEQNAPVRLPSIRKSGKTYKLHQCDSNMPKKGGRGCCQWNLHRYVEAQHSKFRVCGSANLGFKGGVDPEKYGEYSFDLFLAVDGKANQQGSEFEGFHGTFGFDAVGMVRRWGS
ncbi:hypothetical protein VP01_219g2 [Puccinia sorghi]|uniref:Uncharacterized protein n=1 Tax=Puccinia sorghi TaxID=27349 RepID=A0A0L6V8W9_9BASI|nr:hypothetical protein VP01_219g2 [Puccinia sorghi]